MLPELLAVQGMMKYLHHHAKAELEGLDEEGLNWTPPGVEAVNSIYGLALHIAETQVIFAGMTIGQKLRLDIPELAQSNGTKALQVRGDSVDSVRALLRQAAELTNQAFEQATPEQLDKETTLPGGGKATCHSWPVIMVSHTAEHVGHMSLTRQLYNAQRSS